MRERVAGEPAEIAVHTLKCAAENGTVLYASLPFGSAPRVTEADRDAAKQRLVVTLWDHLAAGKAAPGNRPFIARSAGFPIRLSCDRLGKPGLLSGAERGPAISFSEGGGRLWAALSGDVDFEIGIDVAGFQEFQGSFPFHRVFQAEELRLALELAHGEPAAAAALLWSVKEAAVKALGCAFHLVEPGQIAVHPSADRGEEGWLPFEVRLSAKALVRFPGAGQSLRVHAFPQERLWLSVARLNRGPACHA